MINKQKLWFLTLFSLILVLSVYYITMPSELLTTAKTSDKNAVTEKTETKKSEREGKIMEKTLKIEGMMCGHCEATVKKCLEAVDGVVSADVSHTNGTAVVKLDKDVPYDTLKSAVENQGYKVIG